MEEITEEMIAYQELLLKGGIGMSKKVKMQVEKAMTVFWIVFKRNLTFILILGALFFASAFFVYFYIIFRAPGFMGIQHFYQRELEILFHEIERGPTENVAINIFLNNTQFYWQPFYLLRWLTPFLGFLMLVSFLVNGGALGFMATYVKSGAGLVIFLAAILPHGLIEIPAIIFMTATIVIWQLGTIKLIYSYLTDKPRSLLYVKDVAALSILAITLFFLAALIEYYITLPLVTILVS